MLTTFLIIPPHPFLSLSPLSLSLSLSRNSQGPVRLTPTLGCATWQNPLLSWLMALLGHSCGSNLTQAHCNLQS